MSNRLSEHIKIYSLLRQDDKRTSVEGVANKNESLQMKKMELSSPTRSQKKERVVNKDIRNILTNNSQQL